VIFQKEKKIDKKRTEGIGIFFPSINFFERVLIDGITIGDLFVIGTISVYKQDLLTNFVMFFNEN